MEQLFEFFLSHEVVGNSELQEAIWNSMLDA